MPAVAAEYVNGWAAIAPRQWIELTCDQTHQRGLARAVRAEDSSVLASADAQAEAIEDQAVAAHHAGIVDIQQRCRGEFVMGSVHAGHDARPDVHLPSPSRD